MKAAVTLASFLLLSACCNTSGVEKDMSKAGSAIKNSADKHSYQVGAGRAAADQQLQILLQTTQAKTA